MSHEYTYAVYPATMYYYVVRKNGDDVYESHPLFGARADAAEAAQECVVDYEGLDDA